MSGFEEQESNHPAGEWTTESLEEQLAEALARCEPPADFSTNLMARVAQIEARREKPWYAQPWCAKPWQVIAESGFPALSLRWAPALAAIVLVAGGLVYQEHERTVEGLRAKQQLLEALRITNAKLRETGARVAQVETSRE